MCSTVLPARAIGFVHPDIQADMNGPTGLLASGAEYMFVGWIVNKAGMLSEDGQNPKITVTVTGGSIKSASSPYLPIITKTASQAEFSSTGLIKKGTSQFAIFTIEASSSSLTVTVHSQAEDVDSGWPDYNAVQDDQTSLAYSVTSMLGGTEIFANLAEGRMQCVQEYMAMYENYVRYGRPFYEDTKESRHQFTSKIVDSAKATGELLAWAEIMLTGIVDPAAGIFSAWNKILGDTLGMPSLMSLLDFAEGLLEYASRLLYYYTLSMPPLVTFLAPGSGALEEFYDALVEEKTAWNEWDFSEVSSALSKEKKHLTDGLQSVIGYISTANSDNPPTLPEPDSVKQMFEAWKAYLEQELKTVSDLEEIIDDMKTKSLDLVFVIDVTGSMWDDIAEVKVSATEIVDSIDSQIAGYRIAVVSYRDFPVLPYGGSGDWAYKDVLSFSTDKTQVVSAIQSLVVGGGADWRESVYSALMHAIDASTLGNWRTGANKFIILMGDAPPHDPEPFTDYTLSSVTIAAEEADPVIVDPIVIGTDSTAYAAFSAIAEGTNGEVFTAATASEVPAAIIEAIEEIIDTDPPSITVVTPRETPPEALQDGVTLEASVSDASGVDWVTFSIREADGTIIDPAFESMAAVDVGDDLWQVWIDTNVPELPDGHYMLGVNASDMRGNEGYKTVQFSIRNWACLELLPATETNKARRTMPVKFSLRVFENVDPAQPFVFNEELTVLIYEEGHPESILQESTYGDTARDYRIDSIDELYITNFRTMRTPTTYVIEVYRKDLLIGWFTFETGK
jgi:hypothetical protein